MAEFCVHERHGGICEKTGTYCNLGACPYEDLQKFATVRHGRWVWYDLTISYSYINRGYMCSVCKFKTEDETNYCPNCGAVMDLED